MHDVSAMWAAWARNGPPTYISMAAQVGFKAPDDDVPADDNFDQLLKDITNGNR